MVPQDLLRIDLALRDGSFFENPALTAADPARAAARRDAPPHGPPLRRRRPLAPAPPRGPPRARAHGAACRASSSTSSPTAATRRRAPPSRYVARARGVARSTSGGADRHGVGPLLRDGPRQAVGPRGARLRRRSCSPSGLHARERDGGHRGGLRARRDRRVHPADRDHRGRRAARPDPRRRRGRLLQLPGGPRPAAHAGPDRAGVRRLPAAEAPDAPLRQLHGVQEGVRPAGRLPAARPDATSSPTSGPSAGIANLRLAETEKYAHVTYFFNGGVEEPYPGRGADPRPVLEGRDLRPPPRDERRRDHRGGGPGARATDASARSSSTSPTPTWSATRASCPRRSRRSRSLDRLLRHPRGRVPRGGRRCSDDRRPRQRRADDRPGDRRARTRPTRPTPCPFILVRRRRARSPTAAALADVAPTLLGAPGLRRAGGDDGAGPADAKSAAG